MLEDRLDLQVKISLLSDRDDDVSRSELGRLLDALDAVERSIRVRQRPMP
jgi:hypothetical protein